MPVREAGGCVLRSKRSMYLTLGRIHPLPCYRRGGGFSYLPTTNNVNPLTGLPFSATLAPTT